MIYSGIFLITRSAAARTRPRFAFKMKLGGNQAGDDIMQDQISSSPLCVWRMKAGEHVYTDNRGHVQ